MRYLHVLVPKYRSEKLRGGGWKGRVMEIETRVRKVFDMSFRNSKDAIKSIEANQKVIMEQLNELRNAQGQSSSVPQPLHRPPLSGGDTGPATGALRRRPSGYVPIDEVGYEYGL
eukprot:evm.model.scf_2520.2 EVM.evm.TU.scf_2520.2   scf_2520:13942-14569(+)